MSTDERIWKGKPAEHKWAILSASELPNGNIKLRLTRELTGESLPDYSSFVIPAAAINPLVNYLTREE